MNPTPDLPSQPLPGSPSGPTHHDRAHDEGTAFNSDSVAGSDPAATSNVAGLTRVRDRRFRVQGVDTEPLDAARHHQAVTALAALIDRWHCGTGTAARVDDSRDGDSQAA